MTAHPTEILKLPQSVLEPRLLDLLDAQDGPISRRELDWWVRALFKQPNYSQPLRHFKRNVRNKLNDAERYLKMGIPGAFSDVKLSRDVLAAIEAYEAA